MIVSDIYKKRPGNFNFLCDPCQTAYQDDGIITEVKQINSTVNHTQSSDQCKFDKLSSDVLMISTKMDEMISKSLNTSQNDEKLLSLTQEIESLKEHISKVPSQLTPIITPEVSDSIGKIAALPIADLCRIGDNLHEFSNKVSKLEDMHASAIEGKCTAMQISGVYISQ